MFWQLPYKFALHLSLIGTLLGASLGLSSHAQADDGCNEVKYQERAYVVCAFESGKVDLRLYWQDENGKTLGSFPALAAAARAKHEDLIFAMNAGFFHSDYSPVGLFVEGGKVLKPINLEDGDGNFFLKPNGVFYLDGAQVGILESAAYSESSLRPQFATQSGPMLVIDGAIHPKILPTTPASSRKVRNAVGIKDGKTIYFAISNDPVSFREIADLFRDRLNCQNALFLNGSISSLHAPKLGRSDRWLPLGPIFGVTRATVAP